MVALLSWEGAFGLAVASATWLVARAWSRLARCPDARVSELWVYPVKGCAGVPLREGTLVKTGLEFDRRWCVVRRQGASDAVLLAQDRYPCLRKVIPNFERTTNGELYLVLAAPEMPQPLRVKVVQPGATDRPTYNIEHFDIKGAVEEVSDQASAWFTEFLGEPVAFTQLACPRAPFSSIRHQGTSCAPGDATALHDYCTLHLISQEGVRWLAEQIPSEALPVSVTTQQFRPNIVIEGLPFPLEDRIQRLRVGDVEMRVAKLSGRCVTPTTDEHGQRHPLFEPTATLRRLRSRFHQHQCDRDYGGRQPCYMFGLDLFHDRESVIRVGAPVTVLQLNPHPVTFLPAPETGPER